MQASDNGANDLENPYVMSLAATVSGKACVVEF